MPLSNTTNELLSELPYWDDFDGDKRFHRILIRTRLPIQTRELNQMQTILQDQIESLSSGTYVEGQPVRGGEQTFANNVLALQLVRDESIDIATFVETETGIGAIANGAVSGARSQVLQYARQSGETYTAVIVSPLNDRSYVPGESVVFRVGVADYTMRTTPETTVTRPAAIYSVREGIFFLRGFLVRVPQQTLVLSSNGNTPTARVGFTISEEIITKDDDSSLLDPALNTTQYAAPGADRLRLTATLSSRPLSGTTSVEQNADEDFIELARIVDGVLISDLNVQSEPITEDTLARRTYDESGDYVVRPFQIVTTDHNPPANIPNANGTITSSVTLISAAAGGRPTFFETEIAVGDTLVVGGESREVVSIVSNTELYVDTAFSTPVTNTSFTVIKPDLMNVNLSAGKAYVRGYEFETRGTTKLAIPRARDLRTIDNGSVSTFFGPFLYVNRNAGLVDPTVAQSVDLHMVPFANTTANTGGIVNTTATNYAASRIGTARVRSFVYHSGNGDANTVYKLYLTGVQYDTKTYPVQVGASSDTGLTSALVCNTTDQSISLTQIAATAGTYILPRANGAFNGATVQLTSIYGVPLYYNVLRTNLETSTSSTTTHKLYVDTQANFALVNTTANVVVVFAEKSIRGVTTSNAKSVGATVALEGRLGGITAGNTVVYFPDQTIGLFKFRESWVKADSVSDEFYTTMYRKTGIPVSSTSGSDTIFTFTLPTGFTFAPAPQTLPFLHVTVTNTSNQVVSLVGASVAYSSGDSTMTLTIPTAQVGAGGIDVLAKVFVSAGSGTVPDVRRSKVLVTANTNVSSVVVSGTVLVSNTSHLGHVAINEKVNASSGGLATNTSPLARTVGLGVTDVRTLQKVYAVVDPVNTSSWVDVTERYTLDSGQRDWCYDHAAITLRPGYAHYPTANQMLVMVDRFAHTNSVGYFTAKSYDNVVSYEEIPTFEDPASGKTYALRDYADFRYVRAANTTLANTAHNPYVNVTPVFSEQIAFPHPDEFFRADYSHYLPRIDKVVLTRNKELKVLVGQSSVLPVAPADPEDGITLYTLFHEPYTANASTVRVDAKDHRRYTMRDIGRLEKRIERLEYYAQLSQLEERTLNTPELDDDDQERFKNGILIDPFASHAVADVTNPDYRASIDEVQRELRPGFQSHAFGLGLSGGMTGGASTTRTGSLVTLDYTTTEFIKQPLASKTVNVNPFGVASWRGRIHLTPSTDVWLDTVRRPQVTVNLDGENDNWTEIGFGTVWGDWEDIWVGRREEIGRPTPRVARGDWWDGVPDISPKTVHAITTRQGFAEARTGTAVTAKNSRIDTPLGDRVVDASIATYMRSANVAFVASGLKPGANVSAFFDETDVSAYVERASEIRLGSAEAASTFIVGETVVSNSATAQGRATVIAVHGDTLRVVNPTGKFYSTTSPSVGVKADYPSVFRTAAPPDYVAVNEYVSYAGQVSAATTTVVTLDVGASTVNDAYNGQVLTITYGPGAGTKTVITDYVGGATRQATVSPAIPTASLPTTASRYAIGEVVVDPLITTLSGSTGYSLMEYNAPSAASRKPGHAFGMFFLPGTRLENNVVVEPDVKFFTGNRIFRLADSASALLATTSAEAGYQAQGSTRTIESTVVSTRNVSFATSRVRQERAGVRSETQIYLDPIAQTFLVEGTADQYPEGVFVTSVDLFFAKKDPGNAEISVQLRPTVNGFPSADVVLATATLNTVNVVPASTTPNPDNASHYTRFTFAEPVYLVSGVEYCVVVLTNSFEYEVFVGQIGQPVIGTDRLISEQPYAGSFFKSQNARTWTPQQEEDLMFVIRRAEFTRNVGTASFFLSETATNATPSAFTEASTGDYDYDVYNIQTGHIDFTSTAPTTTFSFRQTLASTNGYTTYVTTRVDETVSPDVRHRLRFANTTSAELRVTMATANTHVSPIFDVERLSLVAIKNTIDNGGLYSNGFVVLYPGNSTSDGTVTLTTTNQGITGTAANGAVSGTGATATMTVSGGKVTAIVITTPGSGYLDAVTVNAVPTGHGISWVTGQEPVILYRGETSSQIGIVGEQKARYISRRVNLADGFDARDLKVYLSANRPPDTNIDVYYKVLSGGDPQTFEDKNWVRMILSPAQQNVFASSSQQFRDYEYQTRGSVASYTSNGITYDRFQTFAVKIVMRSATTTVVPRMRNLRVIALDN